MTHDELARLPLPNRDATHVYARERSNTAPGLTLCLDQTHSVELRGGRVWFVGPPYPGSLSGWPVAWDQVNLFLDQTLRPTALAVGARFHLPSPHEGFWQELPVNVREQLAAFSRETDRSLPLKKHAAERWQDFFVTAFRARSVIDPGAFADWLVSQGWSRSAAEALHRHFHDQSQLLTRYADEMSAV